MNVESNRDESSDTIIIDSDSSSDAEYSSSDVPILDSEEAEYTWLKKMERLFTEDLLYVTKRITELETVLGIDKNNK